MPLVTSQTWLVEKLAQYQIGAIPSANRLVKNGFRLGDPPDTQQRGLQEIVSAICSRILNDEPALVADVAAGRVPRLALASLITRTADRDNLRTGFYQTDLQQQVLDFLFGYGPLQSLIDNEDVTDIDGTGPAEFTVKINGRRQQQAVAFADAKAYDTFCRLVIIRNGGIINENDSHCRVTDERYRLRINVTVPPRSLRCASISIRKHRRKGWCLPDLKGLGMLDDSLVNLFTGLAATDATMIFCGKGAAGKTTLLRAFIQAMPDLERILIAESDSELYPEKACCLVQKIKKSTEGGRPVSLRDLISDGLTMSLDTYCIGEIVGDEALEFIRAAFSGHRCLATIHADCAEDCLDRMLTLARPAASGESDRLLRRMLGRSVNYIVFLKDFRVMQVLMVRGYREKEDTYDKVAIWQRQQDPPTDIAAGLPVGALVPGS